MAGYLTAIAARVKAITCQGLGVDGSLGTAAQTRAIPVTGGGPSNGPWFRDAVQHASLTDPEFPSAAFDRALKLRWMGSRPDQIPNNPRDGTVIRIVRLVIDIGYFHGKGLESFIHLIGGETASGDTTELGKRGLSDGERIEYALTWSELYQASPVTDPFIVNCYRDGETTSQTLGGGRYVASSPYKLTLQLDQSHSYDP